jgi:hypothetical protein
MDDILDDILIERLWRSLIYEEVRFRRFILRLLRRASVSASGSAFRTIAAAPGLGLQDPGGGVRGEVYDLPLSWDNADMSPTTPQGQQ